MSYWVYVEQEKCSQCGHEGEFWSSNITYNLSPMWHAAGIDIRALNGKDGRHCASVIGDGLARLKAEPERFKAMNPDNGWGSYDGLVEFLSGMLTALREHPESVVRVS